MDQLQETLAAKADELRQQAKPIWEALLEGHERDRRAFELSLVHLERRRLCITVVGEFNTGKSTLLNTFIGDGLLRTDQLECTAVPTWVRLTHDDGYDENRQATVIHTNGERESMPLAQISAHTTLDHDSWEEIERVEITVPHTVDAHESSHELVFVDTPGLNGRPDLEARSIHQLGMSHVTIVVVSVDGIPTKTNAELIKQALAIADRVMVVINKCDQHKTDAGYDNLREALHDRVPVLRRENIYTLSAKRQFEGAIYEDDEQELRCDFLRFEHDLINRALPEWEHALERRPVALLREICKTQIDILTKLDSESDTHATRQLEEAKARLEDAEKNLEDSRDTIERVARVYLMEEVSILERFLREVRGYIEGNLRAFVDSLADAVVAQDDPEVARREVSAWLDAQVQKSVPNRVDRLLQASARRLVFDLEVQATARVPRLSLPCVVPLVLDTAALERNANRAKDVLRHIADEIATLQRDVGDCQRKRRKLQAETDRLRDQRAYLGRLETQREAAVTSRERLGPKPAPTRTHVTEWETREVRRGGFFGWLFPKRKKRCPVRRERTDYRPVEQWDRDFRAATELVEELRSRIEPLWHVRDEIPGIQRELSKLQREEDRAASKLQAARRRLKDEQARYRKSDLKKRRALLEAGAAGELERIFGSLPRVLEREAKDVLESVSRQFTERFQEGSDRHRASLAAEIQRQTELARAADSGRAKRDAARATLLDALETFLSEPTTKGGTTV